MHNAPNAKVVIATRPRTTAIAVMAPFERLRWAGSLGVTVELVGEAALTGEDGDKAGNPVVIVAMLSKSPSFHLI